MPPESTTVTRWDALYRDERHWLMYPSEHVVRWLASLELGPGVAALDIGCGSGRHLRVMEEANLAARGIDISAIPKTCGWGEQGDMRDLPFDNDTFGVALSYGVFYYGTRAHMEAAVAEMHRVLKPGGHGFVKTRTPHDWRASGIPEGEPEHGMEMTFLAKDDIERVYAAFDTVTFETTATSSHGRERWDSDWLITVTK